MCDMCGIEEDSPTAARPLNKYDYVILVLISLHNIFTVVSNFFSSLVHMLEYQLAVDAKHARDWASISQDLEKLEADNG